MSFQNVLGIVHNPRAQDDIRVAFTRFSAMFPGHPLVDSFFKATSIPPGVVGVMADLAPQPLRLLAEALRIRPDIANQVMQNPIKMRQFIITSGVLNPRPAMP